MNLDTTRKPKDDFASTRLLRLRIPPSPRHTRDVREALAAFGAMHGVSALDVETLLCAVGEALANAVEHAGSDEIEVECRILAGRIDVTIADSGRGFPNAPTAAVPRPDGLAGRGRGLPILPRCAGYMELRRRPGRGTAVVMGRYLHASPTVARP